MKNPKPNKFEKIEKKHKFLENFLKIGNNLKTLKKKNLSQ
jgi:hypothetical protein